MPALRRGRAFRDSLRGMRATHACAGLALPTNSVEEEKKELEDKISAGSPDQNLLNLAISEVEAAFEKANSTILNIINCEKIE